MPHSPCHQRHSLPCGSYVSLGCIPDYAAQSFSYSSSTPLFSILLHSRSKQVAYILLFYLKPTHQGLHQVVLSGKELLCQGRRCKKHRFNPCVGMIPWRRVWQPTLIFLPGKSHGQILRLFLPSKETEQILQRKTNNPGALTQQKGLAIKMRAKKESWKTMGKWSASGLSVLFPFQGAEISFSHRVVFTWVSMCSLNKHFNSWLILTDLYMELPSGPQHRQICVRQVLY